MNKNTVLILATITTFLLAGCQFSSQPPERPLNKGDRSRVTTPIVAPEDEILPVLKISKDGQEKEMKLRSQTTRFLDDSKKTMEITLSSSRTTFCENESPELLDGDERLVLTLKSNKDAITIGDAKETAYELSGKYKNADGEIVLTAEEIKGLTISDLNDSIVRGNVDLGNDQISIKGEFFTAICK